MIGFVFPVSRIMGFEMTEVVVVCFDLKLCQLLDRPDRFISTFGALVIGFFLLRFDLDRIVACGFVVELLVRICSSRIVAIAYKYYCKINKYVYAKLLISNLIC